MNCTSTREYSSPIQLRPSGRGRWFFGDAVRIEWARFLTAAGPRSARQSRLLFRCLRSLLNENMGARGQREIVRHLRIKPAVLSKPMVG